MGKAAADLLEEHLPKRHRHQNGTEKETEGKNKSLPQTREALI
jgi:hypothetical protein